ncbi:MAG: ELWxxDGT repeat protein, partial [Planctomycetaceae bacterium]
MLLAHWLGFLTNRPPRLMLDWPRLAPRPRASRRRRLDPRLNWAAEVLEDRTLLSGVDPVLLKDINQVTEDSWPSDWVDVNGTVFFTAEDGTTGRELWKTDGTAAGTVLVKDINPGSFSSNPSQLTNVNGTLCFTAFDGANGRELWMSDGTAAGTVLVTDINPGSNGSNPFELTNVNGTLFFGADDGTNGRELWTSDCT